LILKKPKCPWQKLDIIIEVKSKEKFIFDFSFLMFPRHYSKVAKWVFKRFKFKNINIITDKGHYFFGLFSLIKLKNNNLIISSKNYDKKCLHNRLIKKNFNQTYYDSKGKYEL